MVSDAIHWLIENNLHYSDIELNYHALNSLPVNSVPNEILSIETNDTTIDDSASFSPDFVLLLMKKILFITAIQILQVFHL